MRAILVMAAVLAGCATRTVVVAPGTIAHAASDLQQYQRAKVYSLDGQVTEIHAHDKVEVLVRQAGSTDLQIHSTLTLEELSAGCIDPSSPDCIADRVVDQRIAVRHVRHVDGDTVAKGVGFLAIGGLTGYCLAECQDQSSVPKAFGYTAAVVGGAALLFVLLVALGPD